MKSTLPQGFVVFDGCVFDKASGYFMLAPGQDGVNFCGVSRWIQGHPLQKAGMLQERPAGVACFQGPNEKVVAVGQQGAVSLNSKAGPQSEKIGVGDYDPTTLGPLRAVRKIGEHVYVVGMRRQVFRRSFGGPWARFDQGLEIPEDVKGFEAVNGRSENDFYAAGWDGEIFHFDGEHWSQLKSPTNRILTDICFSETDVYICGQAGTLLKGRIEADGQPAVFEEMSFAGKHANLNFDYWGVAWFQGALYLSTFRGLLKYDGSEVAFVETGDIEVGSYYRVREGDGVLWSIGADDVVSFDGASWTRII